MRYPLILLLLIGLENSAPVQLAYHPSSLAHSAQQDTSFIPRWSMARLRNRSTAPEPDYTCYVTDPGKQGFFAFAPADKTTPDDSAMTIVSESGFRFKRIPDNGYLNAHWFGAKGNGGEDDWYALQKGINYTLSHSNTERTLFLPPGSYKISKPLIIARLIGSNYQQSSINLEGPANSKALSAGGAVILPMFNDCFAIGVQLGKGVFIRNLSIVGHFTFPDRLTAVQVDTLSAAEWTDGSSRDNPVSPYAGIAIDPFSDSTVYSHNSDMYPGLHAYYPAGISRGGSTSVQITGCSIRNFIVGVMLTPSNQQNADLIDVIDCDISSNKVAYAMGQAQSKECHVERLKCWGPTHTLFNNVDYGFRHGDGANIPMVDGVNIASQVKQLCRIHAASFSGVFRNVYAEGLFRLGYVGGIATVSFEDCQIDFATQNPGIPYPDFFVLGSGASFHGCMLRCYTGGKGVRLILSGTNNYYEGGLMNEPPVAVNLDNAAVYPNPSFKNVAMYYSGGLLGSKNTGVLLAPLTIGGGNGAGTDPVYYGNTYQFNEPFYGANLLYKLTYTGGYERTARLTGMPVLHVNHSNWTAWFRLDAVTDTSLLRAGDFILTSGLRYQDDYKELQASTYPVGFVQADRS